MTTQKQEYSALDANPVVLYAKDDADDKYAFPVLRSFFNPKFNISTYDRIQLSYTSGNLTGVTYSASGSTVGILGLTYSTGVLVDVIRVL